MSGNPEAPDASASRGSKKPLLIGLALALLGAGGGFFATQSGVLGFGGSAQFRVDDAAITPNDAGPAFAFVAIEPLIISLPGTNGREHLRFAAQLEVDPGAVAAVEAIKPRIVDILNGYLRAVRIEELEDPTALLRLRAQMLRRIHVVAGPEQVKDLLIMEFVLS